MQWMDRALIVSPIIKDEMGEKLPSLEFEAYSVQRVAQNLFFSYKSQKKKK